MAIEDYLAALFSGQTGTNDPSAAGFMLRPNLMQPPQPMPSPPMAGPPPSIGGMAQGVSDALGNMGDTYRSNLDAMRMRPPPIPGPLSPPPPIPDAVPMPPGPPQAPGPMPQRGGARILAQLYNPEPIQAPGGGNLPVNLIGPQSGPYAALQQQAAQNARGASQQPAAPPTPQQPPQQQPTAPPQPLQGGIGSNIQGHIGELKSNPDFQRVLPPSTKPGFYDNLLRFGLAAMAAGGKPGSNTLGALGEAGLSTFDNSQKAGQTDFENTLAARKVGIQAQDQISKAYERLDGLKQRSEDTRLSIEQRAEAARQANILHAQIAQMTNQLGRDRLDETSAANADRAADRADKTQDRQVKQAEVAQQHAAEYYRRQRDAAEKVNPLGITPETELRITRDTATAHPNSVYAREWEAQKSTQLNDARAFIQAHPAEKPKAIEKLRKIGIDPREL